MSAMSQAAQTRNATEEGILDAARDALADTPYRRLTMDLYDHGKLLRDDKFSWLYWSFTLFLFGMVATALAVLYQLYIR